MSRPSWRAQGRPSGAASVPARSRSCDIARSRAWHEVPVWPGACLRGLPDTDDVDGDRVEREATALDAAVCRLDSERVRGRGPRLQVNWERCPQRRRRSNNKRCNNSAVHLDVQDHGRSHRTPDAAYARVVGELGFEPRDVHLVPRLCPGVASQRDLLVRACCRGGQSAGAADTGDDRAAGYSGAPVSPCGPCVPVLPCGPCGPAGPCTEPLKSLAVSDSSFTSAPVSAPLATFLPVTAFLPMSLALT